MQKIKAFDDEVKLSKSAKENVKVAELWEISSAFFKNVVASSLKDFGLIEERDRIILSVFVIPALACLKKGFSEEAVAAMPEWKLVYAADFTGPPEKFEETLLQLQIDQNSDIYRARKMIEHQKDWVALSLENKFPAYEMVLQHLPDWVETDDDKIDYVSQVYLEGAPVWYLNALQRMSREQFLLIKRCKGNPLMILCLQNQFDSDQLLVYRDIGLCLWISIFVKGEFISIPTYRWEVVSEVLQHPISNIRLKEDNFTLYVTQGAIPACLKQLPVLDYNTQDPVRSFCEDKLSALGLSELLENSLVSVECIHSCIYPALLKIINRDFEYYLYLKYFPYLSYIQVCERNMVFQIVDNRNINSRYDNNLAYGMLRIHGEIHSAFLAEISGLLKDIEQEGGVIDVGTSKANRFNLDWHLKCIREWMQ